MIENNYYRLWVDDYENEMTRFLIRLASIRSYSHNEQEACLFCYDVFSNIRGLKVTKLFINNSITLDPLYSGGLIENPDYTGHFNIELIWKGTGEQLPIYLNAHIDTVPESRSHMLEPAWHEDGKGIAGLGISDDKSGIAVMFALFNLLSKNNIQLPFDVIGHIVVEEETGGNGTLAVMRSRELKGQAAIVMDDTYGTVWPKHGTGFCIKVATVGTPPVHPSQSGQVKIISAYDLLLKATEIVKLVHLEYQEFNRLNPCKDFEDAKLQPQIRVVRAGDYFGRLPYKAYALVSFPILQNVKSSDWLVKIKQSIYNDENLRDSTVITPIYDREGADLPLNHPLALQISQIAKKYGLDGDVLAFRAVTDAVFYNNYCGIPTVTFGPGGGGTHGMDEFVDIELLKAVCCVVLEFILGKVA